MNITFYRRSVFPHVSSTFIYYSIILSNMPAELYDLETIAKIRNKGSNIREYFLIENLVRIDPENKGVTLQRGRW